MCANAQQRWLQGTNRSARCTWRQQSELGKSMVSRRFCGLQCKWIDTFDDRAGAVILPSAANDERDLRMQKASFRTFGALSRFGRSTGVQARSPRLRACVLTFSDQSRRPLRQQSTGTTIFHRRDPGMQIPCRVTEHCRRVSSHLALLLATHLMLWLWILMLPFRGLSIVCGSNTGSNSFAGRSQAWMKVKGYYNVV